ncbi:hypothetical protein F8388_018975 [Cannabis sativa]|uniref:Uncharacterized protein n=1 Tax=Cannabis sativa TaxID=3483 RepID=A0A7J6I7K7_CANSA|nr:hypothetical protein F8388_018975 [Cannabis sativa]KAF4403553.1 hypothetical protein G4B88_002406 [Cannabis sativa]
MTIAFQLPVFALIATSSILLISVLVVFAQEHPLLILKRRFENIFILTPRERCTGVPIVKSKFLRFEFEQQPETAANTP